MNTHKITGQVNIDDFVVGREIAGVTRDNTGVDYLLLHRHVLSDPSPGKSVEHYVLGTITAIRGATHSVNRKMYIEINSSTAYDTTHINAINKGFPNVNCKTYHITYKGVVYSAIQIPQGSTMHSLRFSGRLRSDSADHMLYMVHGDNTDLSNPVRVTPTSIDIPGSLKMRGLGLLNHDGLETVSFDGGGPGQGGSQSMKNASGQETFNLSSGGPNGESTLALKNTAGKNTVQLTGGTTGQGGGLSVMNSTGGDTFNVSGGDNGGVASTSIKGTLGMKNADGNETMNLDGGASGEGATQSMKNASGQETFNLQSGKAGEGSTQNLKNADGVSTFNLQSGDSGEGSTQSLKNADGNETFAVDGGGSGGTASTSILGTLGMRNADGTETMKLDGGPSGGGSTQSMKNASGQETYNVASGGSNGGSTQTFKNSSGQTTVSTTGGTSTSSAGTSYKNDAGIETLSLTVVDGGGGLTVNDSEGNSTVSMDGESGGLDVTGTAAISNAQMTSSTTETMFVTDKVEMLAGTNQLGGEFSPTGADPTTPHLYHYDKYTGTFFISDIVGVMSRSQDGKVWSTCKCSGISSVNIVMEMTSIILSTGKMRLLAFMNQAFTSGVSRTMKSDDFGDSWQAHGNLVMESTYYAGGANSRNRTLHGGSSVDSNTNRSHFVAGARAYGFSAGSVRGSYPYYESYINNTTLKNHLKNFFISDFLRFDSQAVSPDANYPTQRNLVLTQAELSMIYMPEGDWWQQSRIADQIYSYTITMYNVYWLSQSYHYGADLYSAAGGSYPGSSSTSMHISGLRHMLIHKENGGTIDQSFINNCPVRVFFVCNTSQPLYDTNAGWAYNIPMGDHSRSMQDSVATTHCWVPYRTGYLFPWSTVRTTTGINSIANGGWGLQASQLCNAWKHNGTFGPEGNERVSSMAGNGRVWTVDPADTESLLSLDNDGLWKIDTREVVKQHEVQHNGTCQTNMDSYSNPTMSVSMNRYFSENELAGYMLVSTGSRSTLLTNNSTLGARNYASRYITGNTAGTTVTLNLDNSSGGTNYTSGSYPVVGYSVQFYKVAIAQLVKPTVDGVPFNAFSTAEGNISSDHVNRKTTNMLSYFPGNNTLAVTVGSGGTASSADYSAQSYSKLSDIWTNTYGNGLKVPSFRSICSNSIAKFEIVDFPKKYSLSSSPHLALTSGEEWGPGASYITLRDNHNGNLQYWDPKHANDQANQPLPAYSTSGNDAHYHWPSRTRYHETTQRSGFNAGPTAVSPNSWMGFSARGSSANVEGIEQICPGFYYIDYQPSNCFPILGVEKTLIKSMLQRAGVGNTAHFQTGSYGTIASVCKEGTPDTTLTDSAVPTNKRHIALVDGRNSGWFWLTSTNNAYNAGGAHMSSSQHNKQTYGYDPLGDGSGAQVYVQQIPGGNAIDGPQLNTPSIRRQESQIYSASKLMGRWHPDATSISYDGISNRTGEECFVLAFWDERNTMDKADWNVDLLQSAHAGGSTGYVNTSQNTSTDTLCRITTVYSNQQWSSSYTNNTTNNRMYVVLKKSTTFGGKSLAQFANDNVTRAGATDSNPNHAGTEYVMIVKISLKSNPGVHFHQSFVVRTGNAWPDEPDAYQLNDEYDGAHTTLNIPYWSPLISSDKYVYKNPCTTGGQILVGHPTYTNVNPGWMTFISTGTMSGLTGDSRSNVTTYVANYKNDFDNNLVTVASINAANRGHVDPSQTSNIIMSSRLCYLPNNGGFLSRASEQGYTTVATGWEDDVLWVHRHAGLFYMRRFKGPSGIYMGQVGSSEWFPLQSNNKLYFRSGYRIFFCEIPTLYQMTSSRTFQPDWTEITSAMTGLFQPVGIVYAYSIGQYVIAGEGGNYVTSVDGQTTWESKIRPQFSFTSKPDTGLFKDTNHDLHLTHNGQNKLSIDINGVNINAQPLTVNSLLRKRYQSQTMSYPNLTFDNGWRNLGTARWEAGDIPSANGGGVIVWMINWHLTATSNKFMRAYTNISNSGSLENTYHDGGVTGFNFYIQVVYDAALGYYVIQYKGYDTANGTTANGNISWEIHDPRPECVIEP